MFRRSMSKMRLVQFTTKENSCQKVGVLKGDHVVDLNASDKELPNSLVKILQREDALCKISSLADNSRHQYPVSDVHLMSPITKPDKVLGVALNFKDDADKRGVPYPPEPIVFSKFASVIVGPNDPVPKPEASNSMDWEGELVAVIGKRAKHVKAENALDYVFGYTASQDLTAKDWAKRSGGQFTLAKNMDGFNPLGPCLVTKDEISDPHDVRIRTWVNAELKQDGNTKNMIFSIDKIIEYITSAITLLPGDVILTGTPFGTGSSQNPPQFLKEGDLLETEVEGVGRLSNCIVRSSDCRSDS